MARLRYNGLATGSAGSTVALALGASLTNSATSITFNAALTHSNGTAVPTITGSNYIPLSILDVNGHLSEVVWLTAYTAGATTGTIARGKEGTTGVAHSSGDKVICSILVADLSADRRWFAGPSDLSIDEFNDDTLDAAWVRVDGTGAASGNLDWTEGADVLSMYNKGGDTTDKFHALLRPLTGAGGSMSAGDAFVTCVNLWAQTATNYSILGLALADGTTFGSGNQVFAELGITSASTALQAFGWTGFGTAGTNAGALPNLPAIGMPLYVRLVMTAANTWRADYSIDGVSWWLGTATLSKTMTPTHVGFMDSSYGSSTKHLASFEFLRRVSGVS